MQVTNTLQALVFGDRSMFIVNREFKPGLIKPSTKQLIKFLIKLESKGYAISNPEKLFLLSKVEFKKLKEELAVLIDDSTKSGIVLRTTFFDEPYPTDYSDEEWTAIFAQYAITYAWTDQYQALTNRDPQLVLQEYINTFSNKAINLTSKKMTNIKEFKLGFVKHELIELIRNMLESKAILRTQQIATIKACPVRVVKFAAKGIKIPMKETLVLIMGLLKNEKLDFTLLQTASDVLRFIVSTYAETPLEGQILKADLKDCKIHIPTSARKMLLNNLEMIASGPKGAKFLTEDMYQQESYWKIIHKYLQFEKYEKTRTKYPMYTAAIDLLYEGDHSWTFNGRFSAAKEELDYYKAINVAAEKPGFLLRNMMEFMRMAKGVRLPKKLSQNNKPKIPTTVNNPFQNKLSKVKKEIEKAKKADRKDKKRKTKVQTDASAFFKSPTFQAICETRLDTKLAFQLIEQIRAPNNNKDQFSRVVQGIKINYEEPVPKLNKAMKKIVTKTLEKSIKHNVTKRTKSTPTIYLDPDCHNLALQYSGRESTEISYSGGHMSKNSIIPIGKLRKKGSIVRLGVMWRGKESGGPSIDIDHSVNFINPYNEFKLYYGHPVYKTNAGKVLAASSGDTTSCGGQDSQFSVELIDVDIEAVKAQGVTDFYNTFIDFGGRTAIGKLECYVFMQVLKHYNVKTKTGANNVKIDLAKTDYAIQIDPNNQDNTGSYIGLHFNLEQDTVEVLAIPVKSPSGEYSNVQTMGAKFLEVIQNRTPALTLEYAIDIVFNKDNILSLPKEASIVISTKTAKELKLEDTQTLLNPLQEMEKVNELIF